MKHLIRLAALIAAVFGILLMWPKAKHNTSERSSASVVKRPTTKAITAQKAAGVPAAQVSRPTSAAAASAVRAPANSPASPSSLEDMSRTLFEYTRPQSDIKALVEYLEKTRQEPMVIRDANPYSGEMAIVRTKSPLAGTRYFHAQYFADENGKGFVQHMSFEFKPGPNAMNEAVKSVQRQFRVQEPQIRRADYAQWSLSEGYILWVKKMDTPDLQDDPFNAYTPADKGTIRVAIEAEIH